jgi:acyl carrier protein phosphodiesterase
VNYLAHAYLSFKDPEILVGNMISDFVKGKKKFDYPLPILQGIDLHRSIDRFTDTHPATRKIKEVFQNSYGKYSGAFADIVYDHFLARDSEIFPENALWDFSQWVYGHLDRTIDKFPERFAAMYPYMKRDNWLFHYKENFAVQRSFRGLVHRAAYLTESETAFGLFEENYELLEECYRLFFPDLLSSTTNELKLLRMKINTING